MEPQAFIDQAETPGCLLPWEDSLRLQCDMVNDDIDHMKASLEVVLSLLAKQDQLVRTMVAVNKQLLDKIDRMEGRA